MASDPIAKPADADHARILRQVRSSGPRFSSRVPSELRPNAIALALRAARAAARPLLDLTLTNPTAAGLEYADSLLAPLADPNALVYEPAPFGQRSAREAVAADYDRRGLVVSPDRIVLTASTSEAYSHLFKLLCGPAGDNVLTPAPSYPLFEHLTQLDGVIPVQYRLEYHGRWTVDLDSVRDAWRPNTRALLAVSPNNPTGSMLSRDEEDALSGLCAARRAALIVDEVFADYPLQGSFRGSPRTTPCLTFRLGGLSKSAGLPQVKLGWMAVEGPDEDVAPALAGLEVICDAYLSVSTPVQAAAAALIEAGAGVRRQILARVRRNYDHVRFACGAHPSVEVLHAEAGWSVIVRVPSRATEEQLVLDLLEHDGVIVHPGFFFDFPREAFLVLSLLPPPPVFDEGVARVLTRAGGEGSGTPHRGTTR